MANENKKINELVADDDDPTSELEAPTFRQLNESALRTSSLEAEEGTYQFGASRESGDIADRADADLRAEFGRQQNAFSKLQYDYEQLHARWQGLQAEVNSRKELSETLSADLKGAEGKLDHYASLLQQRDQTIEKLRDRINDRDLEFENQQKLLAEYKTAKTELESGDEIRSARQKLVEYDGAMAGLRATLSGLRNQQQQTESYADGLRRQLADLRADSKAALSERAELKVELGNAEATIAALESKLVNASRAADNAESALAAIRDSHEQEIRVLRFELGESQETLAEHTQVSEQLAADLVENRGYKIELERMLTDTESRNRERIEHLEIQIGQLEDTVADYEQKLEAKNTAINALLAELAKKDDKKLDADEAGHVIYGDEPSHTGPAASSAHSGDRVSRLLIGRIDQQELRFPLFKNRLTIGRTQQNDIYLKAAYISRRHAVVVTEGDSTRIIDWGSKNGVYVNSKRVTEHFLKSGDKVGIGTIEFRYEELPKRDAS
jgi:chromosome segregation ATPase